MTAALQRLLTHLPLPNWTFRRQPAHEPIIREKQHMVGEFRAEYGPIPREELAHSDPEMERILRESKVVSSKEL